MTAERGRELMWEQVVLRHPELAAGARGGSPAASPARQRAAA